MHAGHSQSSDSFQKRQWVEHHAIANKAAAPGAQHPARHELEYELLAINDDGVAGVMSSSVAGNHLKALRQYVNDLSLALIAPLGANDHRGCAFFQFQLRQGNSRAHGCASPGFAHSSPAGCRKKDYWDRSGEACTRYLIVPAQRIATRERALITKGTKDHEGVQGFLREPLCPSWLMIFAFG